MKLFTAIFESGEKFKGGDLINTKWLDIPQDKKIKTLIYKSPVGKKIYLSDYDMYYHFIEATMDLNGKNSGKKIIRKIMLIGKKDNKNTIHEIDLTLKKINVKELSDNDEFIKKLNPMGWKK